MEQGGIRDEGKRSERGRKIIPLDDDLYLFEAGVGFVALAIVGAIGFRFRAILIQLLDPPSLKVTTCSS